MYIYVHTYESMCMCIYFYVHTAYLQYFPSIQVIWISAKPHFFKPRYLCVYRGIYLCT